MTDLLVSLYNLTDRQLDLGADNSDYVVRRALAPEHHIITGWVKQNFSEGWASEASVAMNGQPVRLWLAVRQQEILGFACYDATAKGFFGPTGVLKKEQGNGVGGRLLMATLSAMKEAGYGYGVIGGVADRSFYNKYLDVLEIPGSAPGIYQGMLK